MAAKLDIQEAPDNVFPICPHCRKELRFIWSKTKGLGIVEEKIFLMCPHCFCFLGFNKQNYS